MIGFWDTEMQSQDHIVGCIDGPLRDLQAVPSTYLELP